MAYQFWDGFDNYNGSTELWDAVAGTVAYSSSYARYSAPAGLLGQGIQFSAGGAAYKTKNMLSNQGTMIFCFAAYMPTLGTGGLLILKDGGTVQCKLHVTPSGGFQIWSGNDTLLQASSGPSLITTRTWHWLAIEITVASGTGGSITIYVDGALVWTATGITTETSGNSYCNAFQLGDLNTSFTGLQVDDFHAHDSSGSAPNSILPDSRIYTKVASGAGYTTNWTPTGASANWQCSDDAIPDGDSTYNVSSTPGQLDAYAPPVAGLVGTTNGIVRRSYIRKDDGSAHTFQNGIRSVSTNALGTAATVPSSYGWTDCGTCYTTDPNGGGALTAAAADAMQMVIDETS